MTVVAGPVHDAAPADDGARAEDVAPAPATSVAPRGRDLWRSARGPLALLAVLVLAALVLAALAVRPGADLDPRSYSPGGSRAVAALLEQRGIPVRVVGDLPQLQGELAPGSTVLVPVPAALSDEELAVVASLAADRVVVGAEEPQLEALGLPAVAEPVEVAARPPGCVLPAAARAGTAHTGGLAYRATAGTAGTGCYPTDAGAGLLALPGERTVLLGGGAVLTNEGLETEGDAALALGLLGDGDEVLWLLPRTDRVVPGGRPSLVELVPDAVLTGALQLGVAVVVLALWRARRLGRVVQEPLPVVVRAAETVEGRSRLYRAAGARDRAAQALRGGARERLVHRLGLPTGSGAPAVVETVAARTGRDPADVEALLYGPPPRDDAALVRLADDLDGLVPHQP